MTGGVGFSKSARKSFDDNRDLLKRREPFQKIEENPFIKESGKKKWQVSRELIKKLIELKAKKRNSGKVLRTVLYVFVLVYLVYFLLFFFFR